MDLLIAFILFVAAMGVCLWLDVTMLIPLGVGFVLFTLTALRRGFPLKKLLGFIAGSFKDSFIVIRILLIIGCLTGSWRQCGTVAYFVSAGVNLIPPGLFLLSVFLLSAAMSYAIGTSFGVTATAGVILMSIARAGNVSPVLAAGAVMSGVYVGDRGSPAASCGNLVAAHTHTDMRENVKLMLRSSLVPFALTCVFYGVLSLTNPVSTLDTQVLTLLENEFTLKWYCLIPAVLMIALPFMGLKVRFSMLVSLAASCAVGMFVQKAGILNCMRAMVFGYEAIDPALTSMVSGGGILSMLEVCGILLISGTYGGIFRGTGMLEGVNGKLSALAKKVGRFPAMVLISLGSCGLFCNQTIGAIMVSQLSDGLYGESEKQAKMLDMENSVIVLAGLVPWCIASSVPLAMLGAGASSLPAAVYLWLVPLWWAVRNRKKKQVP